MKCNKSWVKTLCGAGAALFLFGASVNAHAIAFGTVPSATTVDTVTQLPSGDWQYQYELVNRSFCGTLCDPQRININSWDLPWFSSAGGISLASITSPTGWSYSIETVGAPNLATDWGGIWGDGLGTVSAPFDSITQVLHWYDASGTAAVRYRSSLSGFGYTALYAPTYAPFQALIADPGYNDFLVVGDPAYPNSPLVFGTVPEPGVGALLLVGLAGLVFVRRKKSV